MCICTRRRKLNTMFIKKRTCYFFLNKIFFAVLRLLFCLKSPPIKNLRLLYANVFTRTFRDYSTINFNTNSDARGHAKIILNMYFYSYEFQSVLILDKILVRNTLKIRLNNIFEFNVFIKKIIFI